MILVYSVGQQPFSAVLSGIKNCQGQSRLALILIYPTHYWSAFATTPAETSAEAKEAFTFNKISSSSSSSHLTPNNLEGAKLRF